MKCTRPRRRLYEGTICKNQHAVATFILFSTTLRHKSHETPIVTCDGVQWTRDVQKAFVSMK